MARIALAFLGLATRHASHINGSRALSLNLTGGMWLVGTQAEGALLYSWRIGRWSVSALICIKPTRLK